MSSIMEDKAEEEFLLQLVTQHTSRFIRYIYRDRDAAHKRLMNDYLVKESFGGIGWVKSYHLHSEYD